MLFKLAFVLVLAFPIVGFSQISKGEGQMATVTGKNIKCYLPKEFVIQTNPPGVVHKESGTMVFAVKVPPEKRASTTEGLTRSFFEDSRYEIISLTEDKSSPIIQKTHGRLYTMVYKIQGFEFERKTLLTMAGADQYLIIANYALDFKGQVQDEVDKVMANFTIR